MKNKALVMFNAALFIVISAYCASGQVTEFTYQGSLKDNAAPANASYDFEFALFDALSGGSQVGATIPQNAVLVTNGLFAVMLDFGAVFPGANRYLEIRVRLSGQPNLTTLTPRQLVNSAPYSVKSLSSDNATNATNAAQLGGTAANQYVLTGDTRLSDARPPSAGSPNYIQNGTSPQASSNFSISGNGTAGGVLSGNIVNSATQFNIGGVRVFGVGGNAQPYLYSNTYVGLDSGTANPPTGSGIYNSFFGAGSGKLNTNGSENSFFGTLTGAANTAGTGNSYFGDLAGASNTTANNGSFFGSGAGFSNTAGARNTFIGQQSGNNNTIGSLNSFLGVGSGITNVVGFNNTALGANADLASNNLQNATAIGANALASQSNSLVLGSINGVNGATANTMVGIGTTSPGTRLDVQNNSSSVAIRVKSTAGSSTLFLDRASSVTANASEIRFMSAGNTDFVIGTSEGLAAASDLTVYSYGSGSNALTIQRSTGNIGLGAVSPSVSLEVRHDGTPASDWQTGQLRISGASDPNMQLSLGYDTSGNKGVIQAGQAFTGFKPLQLNPFGGGVAIGGTTPAGEDLTAGTARIVTGLFLGVVPTGGTSPLCLNGVGRVTLCNSSSLRYKKNVQNFNSGLRMVRQLQPVTFDWKESNESDFGFVAEDVEKIDRKLVFYRNGQIEGVRYDRVGVVLVNAVKEQQAEIEQQQKTIADLKSEVESVKSLVCLTRSKSRICRK